MLLVWGICRNEDLKSAVVGGLPHNSLKNLPLWRISLTKDDWIFGWRSGLASLILNCCLALTPPRLWWVNLFWKMKTPWIQLLRINCWRRRIWFCKNVSRFSMCVPNAWRPFSAARHSQRTAQHSTRNWMRCERHRLSGNVGMSTAYWFSILKISRIVHTIDFILLHLASEFKDSISIFHQLSPRNCLQCWALKSLQFFHITEAFLMSFTKIPILLQ